MGGFDIEDAEAIWTLKQMECYVIINDLTQLLADTTYGQLIRDLSEEKVGAETLIRKAPPYGIGVNGVLKDVDAYLESEVDGTKPMEAIDWTMGQCLVGEVIGISLGCVLLLGSVQVAASRSGERGPVDHQYCAEKRGDPN